MERRHFPSLFCSTETNRVVVIVVVSLSLHLYLGHVGLSSTWTTTMRIQEIEHGMLLAALLLASLAVVARGDSFLASSPRAAFAPRRATQKHVVSTTTAAEAKNLLSALRGGATRLAEVEDLDSDDEEEELDDEEDEEEEEEEEGTSSLDASLAAAALKKTEKNKSKLQSSKTATVKKTVNAKLATPKKKKVSVLKFLRVPYIVRACLNPFTVLSMTKHFWLSLVNLEYPPKVSCFVYMLLE